MAGLTTDPEFCERLATCYRQVRSTLLDERNATGHWEGELSTSALATATAVMALEMVRRQIVHKAQRHAQEEERPAGKDLTVLIEGGVRWLVAHQNSDGGWGDTTLSFSNISTTMLCHAVFHATQSASRYPALVAAAASYIERAGGIPALRARYGKDKTFSIPILTHCALAGLIDWSDVAQLPFELACVPANFYKWAQLPVVSYALPALIAIGQVRHHFVKPKNPLLRLLHLMRGLAKKRSLAILEKIQPASGGFLEATPLTSFVTMSLAGMGRADHPVARRGIEFLVRSVRPDGSWPIDTNLATWVTTLSINALGPDLSVEDGAALRDWLLAQQYRDVHPYTNADPGGWAWTDLSGGVPDADDTPGAILALLNLAPQKGATHTYPKPERGSQDTSSLALRVSMPGDHGQAADYVNDALEHAVGWLLDLQNSDGGWPTFCRGWGALPFDRSAADLTAHAIRALSAWLQAACGIIHRPDVILHLQNCPKHAVRAHWAINRGFKYLWRQQRPDGSWLPLWFGNQYSADDENPVYGTARVLSAYRDCGLRDTAEFAGGIRWLRAVQNADGGWGGGPEVGSSQEETALAVEVLVSAETDGAEPSESVIRGLTWLLDRIHNGKLMEPSPIGFYFAKLWYFEKLYPLIFTLAALRRGRELFCAGSRS
jgi:squalene-hopene/tetraprenyl-beta-curcumene cyclase